jgi:threonine dehydrogenase-like Zn-dependent dehydrogenase
MDEALLHAKVLAGLITSLNDDRVGDIEMKNGEIKVELIRGRGVFGILNIKMTKKMRFNRVIITDPDGGKLRYFV